MIIRNKNDPKAQFLLTDLEKNIMSKTQNQKNTSYGQATSTRTIGSFLHLTSKDWEVLSREVQEFVQLFSRSIHVFEKDKVKAIHSLENLISFRKIEFLLGARRNGKE